MKSQPTLPLLMAVSGLSAPSPARASAPGETPEDLARKVVPEVPSLTQMLAPGLQNEFRLKDGALKLHPPEVP